MKLHIFTHEDADGYAAGYLVYKWYKDKGLKESDYKYHFMNYGKPFPFDQINKGDLVYITDFSIEPEDLIRLHRITPFVVWIDHHISSINKYNDWYKLIQENAQNLGFGGSQFTIDGIRMNGISGCALTYLHLYKGWSEEQKLGQIEDMGEEETFKDAMNDFEDAPLWLQLINDWDVWRHEMENIKPFMMALNNNLCMENITALDSVGKILINDYVIKGRTYIEFRDKWAAQLRERYGFESSIQTTDRMYNVYVLNVGNANSDYFGDLIEKYDAVISFSNNGEKFNYSMYSTKSDVNCADLCRALGRDNGGGHKGAAGFTYKELLFVKNGITTAIL